jgi:hypothetical protein
VKIVGIVEDGGRGRPPRLRASPIGPSRPILHAAGAAWGTARDRHGDAARLGRHAGADTAKVPAPPAQAGQNR